MPALNFEIVRINNNVVHTPNRCAGTEAEHVFTYNRLTETQHTSDYNSKTFVVVGRNCPQYASSVNLAKKTITTDNPESTIRFAQTIGQGLKGGEVIELVSDLGGGKTTFVRGLASGAGCSDHVSSPTFTISNIYEGQKNTIHHFDFYRLHEVGLIEHELHDVMNDQHAVLVVEWSDVVQHVLPKNRLTIHISATAEETRQFELTYPHELEYLVGTA